MCQSQQCQCKHWTCLSCLGFLTRKTVMTCWCIYAFSLICCGGFWIFERTCMSLISIYDLFSGKMQTWETFAALTAEFKSGKTELSVCESVFWQWWMWLDDGSERLTRQGENWSFPNGTTTFPNMKMFFKLATLRLQVHAIVCKRTL